MWYVNVDIFCILGNKNVKNNAASVVSLNHVKLQGGKKTDILKQN